jgi:hypothetical protein
MAGVIARTFALIRAWHKNSLQQLIKDIGIAKAVLSAVASWTNLLYL